jgi:glycerol uptake facilitator-like aquaporin
VEDPVRRAFAEFVGTFTLVFVGAGSIITAAAIGDTSPLLGIAFAHGLAIAVMVSAVGHISGGHFNPAITLGFLVTRRMEPALGAIYVVTQLAAAAAAALVLRFL